MPSRRIFVLGLTSTGLLVTMGAPVLARDISAQEATAITEVFGDGLRFVAVAIRYSGTIPDDALPTADFTVEDRTVTDVYAANSTDPADRSREGEFVIVTLSPEDGPEWARSRGLSGWAHFQAARGADAHKGTKHCAA
ncbi:hypothetical protein SAMN04489859_10536 [Paracoccus alcaliphilus]|uniref:Esterase Ig-like N-terminal domain-containing protein n=1 Tax=Paracoccus alcaliphilus TaxID=34002 RepID=A0A1H8N6V9_9RHOB|nr:hypothetical protein [Paracoccus alcaliphilus]WCR18627.1 hypothetical protein JHW40_02450 [Paracoccus alcaliphilus]SEO25282.1 hypothetical protein SAMN04489859_10536 [Paracoccus alcaliphilus]